MAHALLHLCVFVLGVVVGLVTAIKLGFIEDPARPRSPPYRCCDRVLSEAEQELHLVLASF